LPSRRVHKLVDRIFLGEEFDKVHRFKDRPAKKLGKSHRKVFHDPVTNLIIGLVYGRKAMLSAFLHDLTDWIEVRRCKKRRCKKRRCKKRKNTSRSGRR